MDSNGGGVGAMTQKMESDWLAAGYQRQEGVMAVTSVLRRLAYGHRLLTLNASQPMAACGVRARVWDGACAELVAEWPAMGGVFDSPVEIGAVLESVHYRFFAEVVAAPDNDGAPALRVRLPPALYVLQRRDDFRLAELPDGPLIGCAWLAGRLISFEIADVSAGGIRIGLTAAPEVVPGAQLERCRLELPGAGLLQFGLEIRHIEAAAPPLLWAGCRFVQLSMAERMRLTRYLLDRQRALPDVPPDSTPAS